MVADGRPGRDPLSALRDFVSDLVGMRSVDATFARLLRHLVVQTGAQGACVVDTAGQLRSDWWRGAVSGATIPSEAPVSPWPRSTTALPAWACLQLPGHPFTVWMLFERELPSPSLRRLAELSIQLLALAPALSSPGSSPAPVREAASAVREGLTPDQVLARTAELFVPRLARACVVYQHRQDDLVPVAVQDEDSRAPSVDDIDGPPRQAWHALDERESMIVTRDDAPDAFPDFLDADAAKSAIFLPLVSSGHALGAVGLYGARQFDLRDLELAELIASSTAAALMASSAQVDAQRMADVLVKASLPARIPTVPGFEVAAVYVPVSDAAEVGGDWYDAIELRGGRVGFVVGDVVGHGLSAATTMSQMRNGLRAYLSEGHGPARALSLLNSLAQTGDTSELATVLVGILDPGEGTVRTAAAGAVPPLLVRAAEGDDSLDGDELPVPTGPLVGAFADANYQERLWTMAEGDLFLAFTDGVVERRDRDISDGRQWLADRAQSRPYGPPDAFCETLVDDLRTDGAGEDDICLLAIERTPREQTTLRRRIDPDTKLLAPLRGEVRMLLSGAADLPERTLDDVELVLAELLANAVEASPEDQQIEVYVGHGTGRITIEVTDLGKGFTPPTQISVEPMADRGRGLLLVHAIADRVDVRSADDGTHVRAVVRTPGS